MQYTLDLVNMSEIELDNKTPILYKHFAKSYTPSDNEHKSVLDNKYEVDQQDSEDLSLSNNIEIQTHLSDSNLLVPSTDYESFDEEEIYEIIKNIKDPEYSYSLEDLSVVSKDSIFIDDDSHIISVFFTPTVPHCSQATMIGLMIYVKLYQSLPPYFKIDVQISRGTHNNEEGINKQLLDKERIAAALENPTLVDMINDGINCADEDDDFFQ